MVQNSTMNSQIKNVLPCAAVSTITQKENHTHYHEFTEKKKKKSTMNVCILLPLQEKINDLLEKGFTGFYLEL